MKHVEAIRIVTLVMALTSLAANGFTWRNIKRTQRNLDAIPPLRRQTIHDAWRGGLEEAARAVGTLAERPYDTEPECGAILHAERVIHERIRAMKKEGEEWLTSGSTESSPSVTSSPISNSPTTKE
jgi:hypothetical protein